MGGKENPSTKLFDLAVEEFGNASGEVYRLRLEAIDLRQNIDQLEGDVSRRERVVAASPAVQEKPFEGAYNAETRLARTVEILSSDEGHVLTMARLVELRASLARNDVELESARDARSIARRAADFAIADRRGEDDAETA